MVSLLVLLVTVSLPDLMSLLDTVSTNDLMVSLLVTVGSKQAQYWVEGGFSVATGHTGQFSVVQFRVISSF